MPTKKKIPKHVKRLGIFFLILAGLSILYIFSPSNSRLYPKCIYLSITGWQCPGCGTLRGLHALLHGRLYQAWLLNPLLLVGLPYIALLRISYYLAHRFMGWRKFYLAISGQPAIDIMFLVVVSWAIVRNL